MCVGELAFAIVITTLQPPPPSKLLVIVKSLVLGASIFCEITLRCWSYAILKKP